MRSVLRLLALMATIAFMAGCGRSAFAGEKKIASESQIWLWYEWLVIEIEGQSLPTHLLDWNQFPKTELMRLEPTDGPLNVMAVFKAVDTDISGHVWHIGLLTTEAFIPPPNNQPVYTGTRRESSWARLQLRPLSLPWCSLAELSGLRPMQKNRKPFFWSENIRASGPIGSTAFSPMYSEENNPFKLNIPKRLSIYGDDLRLFEFSLRFTTDDPFNSYMDFFGSRWPLLFIQWSPPELDEMFSTPLPPSQ